MSESGPLLCDRSGCEHCGASWNKHAAGEPCHIWIANQKFAGKSAANAVLTGHEFSSCPKLPLRWGEYCIYEKWFVEERRKELVKISGVALEWVRGMSGNAYLMRVNPLKLWYICFVYANDLKPIRKFHLIDRGCDVPRRAALLARLISKHRPLEFESAKGTISSEEIPDTHKKQNDAFIKANEWFAVLAFFDFLGASQEVFRSSTEAERVVYRKIMSELLFTLTHRDPQVELLVPFARLIKHVHESKKRAA